MTFLGRRCLMMSVLGASLGLATAASAQEVNTVVTTAKEAGGVYEGRAKRVESITSEELSQQGASNVKEALTQMGFAQDANRINGTSQSLIIDGLSSSQISILRDGMMIARLAGSNQGPVVDLSSLTIDPNLVERIDIYRGTGPAGSGGAAGIVIDIISKRGRSATPSMWLTSNVQSTPQNRAATRSVLAGVSLPLSKRLIWRTSVESTSQDAYDVDQDQAVDLPKRERMYGDASLRWRRSRGAFLDLSVLGYRDLVEPQGGETSTFDDLVTRKNARGRLKGRWWMHDDVRLDHQSEVLWFEQAFSKRVRSSGIERPKSQTTQQGMNHNVVATWFVGKHDIQAELSAHVDDITRDGETGQADPETRIDRGAGLTHTWRPVESLETFSKLYGSDSTFFDPGYDAQTGVAWTPHKQWTVRADAAQTRRLPTTEEMFLAFDHGEVGYRVFGNEDLDPEQLRSLNTSLVWRSEDNMIGLETRAWVHRIEEIIINASLPGQPSDFTYVNSSGVATVVGLGANATLGDLPGNLSLRANYTYLPMAQVDGGARLPLRPEHAGGVTVTGKWFGGDLKLWTDLRARSAPTAPQDAPPAPGFTLLGVGGQVKLGRYVSLKLDANNLFDQRDPVWGPAPGFNVISSLSLRYD